MGSFSTALSGLSADSVALNTIGNNLANLNTTAFKKQTTNFEDLFYQQIGENGANDAIQVGVGTKVASTSTSYLQGSLNPTGDTNDMALSGDGFFVVQQNGIQSLTRAGDFQLDSNGHLITTDGESVMGYNAVNGVISGSSSLAPLTLPTGSTESAKATQNFSLTANLNAGATTGTTFSTPVQVYDSLGQTHQLTISFTKTAANTWSYNVSLPAGDYTGTAANTTGTLTFDSSGNLVSPTGTLSGIKFPGLPNGASDLSFNWNLDDSSGNPTVSQTTAASAGSASAQDGFTSGVYNGFGVDSSGVITATYSNGQKQIVGQVAVATVANDQGLTVTGNNNYMTTASSGQANIGVAGTGSRGTITDSALELSNVDISSEFADLIVAQRAFEANSKTVTTFDTVTQDTLSMIR
ncbi:flagellar hook protein FlgE [Edaphobacter dinghuensis]|uniref:Flagellar hook protein FlgE n=1 Tax=Edaphobacter dinghuensis TaxID=1560005 RepID=A0A917M699_9BACT|nr:flagellar hook protein FlgE [Edaphobacter dinghuensis]GGG81706.1 flagellar hook protein FlgE [Edaphobacter dinghuensis]